MKIKQKQQKQDEQRRMNQAYRELAHADGSWSATAQSIIDSLYFDVKVLNAWQHTLLENVISIAQTKLRQTDVSGRSEQLFCPDCKSKARMQNGFIWCENDDCGGIYKAK